jgi:hypothetical protein
MGKALDGIVNSAHAHAGARDWRKAMSDHVAWALLVYTGLHIFFTVKAIQDTGYTMLALGALVILVGIIIPVWQKFEKRWTRLDDVAAHDPALAGAFKRDRAVIWVAAIGMPAVLTLLLKTLVSAA